MLVEEHYCGCLHTKLCSLNLLAMNKEKKAKNKNVSGFFHSFTVHNILGLTCFYVLYIHIFLVSLPSLRLVLRNDERLLKIYPQAI